MDELEPVSPWTQVHRCQTNPEKPPSSTVITVDSLNSAAAGEHRHILDRLGIYPPLFFGYLGVLLFMIGDGVESGFLAPYLTGLHFPPGRVALVFTIYGVTAALAAWFSGALCDLFGPHRVMWIGFLIWVFFEILFLLFGAGSGNYTAILITYALRGFGYPLFAFGFLIWITAATPPKRLGTSVGWFWFVFTGGLPTLGSLFASFTVPLIGEYKTFWCSLVLVVLGGFVALFGSREPTGYRPLMPEGGNPLKILFLSIPLARRIPKLAIGSVIRAINTASQFGFLVFLPSFFTVTIGFTLPQWLRLLSLVFASNIIWNLLFGVIGDKLGWRQTVACFGGLGCAIATLMFYYIPHIFGANYPLAILAGVSYGAVLAGYVPLSALMPTLAPENKGAAMSILNLGAGASVWLGPAIAGLFLPSLGVAGVVWIFAILHLISGVLALFLTLPPQMAKVAEQGTTTKSASTI